MKRYSLLMLLLVVSCSLYGRSIQTPESIAYFELRRDVPAAQKMLDEEKFRSLLLAPKLTHVTDDQLQAIKQIANIVTSEKIHTFELLMVFIAHKATDEATRDKILTAAGIKH